MHRDHAIDGNGPLGRANRLMLVKKVDADRVRSLPCVSETVSAHHPAPAHSTTLTSWLRR